MDLNCVAGSRGSPQREIGAIVAVQVGEQPRLVKPGFLAVCNCRKSLGENPVVGKKYYAKCQNNEETL